MEKAPNKHVGGPPGVKISDGFGGVTELVSKALALVDNNYRVVAAVGDNFWDRNVCCGKLGIVLASGKQVAHNLMEIVGGLTTIEDI